MGGWLGELSVSGPTDRLYNLTDRLCNLTDRLCSLTDRLCSLTDRLCNLTDRLCNLLVVAVSKGLREGARIRREVKRLK